MSNLPAHLLSRRERLEAALRTSTNTPSEQHYTGNKAAPYKDAKFDVMLELHGVDMKLDSESIITPKSREWCSTLLNTEATVPGGSGFQHESFARLMNKIKGSNKARVVQDIARLVVPSAETMHIQDAGNYLVESVDEGWKISRPLMGCRPEPDYSVGFDRKAFSVRQHEKLVPYVRLYTSFSLSYSMATWYMHFPFLASEVMCGVDDLDIADRQNAHSMTIAVRVVVQLFREVKRGDEINKEILAFSVSHNDQNVRIYGHFAVINGTDITYHRHEIDRFNLVANRGE